MNNKIRLLLFGSFLFSLGLSAQDASQIVRDSETKYKGTSTSYTEMDMTIVRPRYERKLSYRSWGRLEKESLTLITAPAKEQGQAFLKSGNNLWSWNPSIRRMIKLPPSMMSQGWMGSDISNDDIMQESSLVKDYTHTLINEQEKGGFACYQIELIPLIDAGVVWGKLIMWISKDDYYQVETAFYDEDMFLVKTHKSAQVKDFGKYKLPSVIKVIPADDPDNLTLIEIIKMEFDIPLDDSFFSQQHMKRIR